MKRPSARCAICSYVQNLRASGAFGKHHLWIGGKYWGVCPGTGKLPEETEAERDEFFRIMAGESRG